MHLQLSKELNNIISYSKEEAMRLGNMTITTNHLLLGIIRHRDNSAYHILESLSLDLSEIKSELDIKLRTSQSISLDQSDKISLAKDAENAIKIMFLEARALKEAKPTPTHLLLAILRSEENTLSDFFYNFTRLASISRWS